MNKLLQINSSLFTSEGQSTQLADLFVADYIKKNPETDVQTLDLSANPLPHLDGDRFTAFITPADERSDSQKTIVAESDKLIADLREASVVVFALPMYNFGIPSVLKAYIDHIARAGETFQYTENGPVGLLEDKPVYIFAARGGSYLGTDKDTQTGYIKTFLEFIGLTNVQFVYAEGLNLGEESKTESLTAARQQASDLIK